MEPFAVALEICSEVGDGLRMSYGDAGRKMLGQGQAHAHAADAERGPLVVRLRGEWSSHKRFCVYTRESAMLKIYRSADDSLRDRNSEATLIVAVCRPRGKEDLAVRTHDGETVVCTPLSLTDHSRWLNALSAAQMHTVSGYIFVNRLKKGWKRRYAIYQRTSRTLCLFQAREGDLSNRAFFYAH